MTSTRTSPGTGSAGWQVATELAGPILTAATAFSLVRVFEGGQWVLPVFSAVAIGHLLALAVRRLGWGMPVSASIAAVGLALTATWTHYWEAAYWGLPAKGVWTALGNDLEQAWAGFGDLSAPVEPVNGFTVSAMAALWLIAFLNDWAAMRLRALFEPMALPIIAMGFAGLVGDDQHQILTISVFTAALLAFALVHRVAVRTDGADWLGGEGRASTGHRALLGGSAAMAAVALAAAIAAGPVLGSDEDPLVDLTEAAERGRGSSGRVVISPLVDISGRLVNQADTVMFRVRAEERSYWRLTSLDQFDGQVWTSRADYAAQPIQLPSLFQSGSSVQESVQQFDIEQLGAVWIPAAFEPRSVVSTTEGIGNSDISYEPASSTLIVGRSLASSNSLSYTVTSALPRFDPEVLKSIPLSTGLEPSMESHTLLPSDFSPRVRELSAQVTAEAGSGYEQALALQSFFRSDDFAYDANVAPGHSGNRIEDFLSTRRGYCEQFAGTFAAMARSLGLPARVAVGFTVGEADAEDPGLYIVRGRHAHAWPEVFLSGVGWVAFEPTPGRGAPGAQNYTGLAEDQFGFGTEQSDPAPQIAAGAGNSLEALTDFESLLPPEALEVADPPPEAPGGGQLSWRAWTAIAAPSLVVLAVLAIPLVRRFRNRRRFLSITGNRGKIMLLWAETVESLALINMSPRPDETYAEFAHRAIAQVPLHSPDLQGLGELAAAAAFAPSDPTDHNQWLARTWSLSVRSEVNFRVNWWQKLAAAFNPRPLFGPRWRRKRGANWTIGT